MHLGVDVPVWYTTLFSVICGFAKSNVKTRKMKYFLPGNAGQNAGARAEVDAAKTNASTTTSRLTVEWADLFVGPW